MTLDEQIAWLSEEGARMTSAANSCEANAKWYADGMSMYDRPECERIATNWSADATRHRERAAMLLTIENTLRAMRDERV